MGRKCNEKNFDKRQDRWSIAEEGERRGKGRWREKGRKMEGRGEGGINNSMNK